MWATGLGHDRRWAVVGADQRIMTGRDYPKLLALRTAIAERGLVVHGPGSSLEIPFPDGAEPIAAVNLWAEERHPGVRSPGAVNGWFSDYLGVECSVVFMDERCRREIATELPSGYRGPAGQVVSYADDFPILLAGEASLADLNGRLEQPVAMAHFRPNIVVAGSAAFEEDSWQRIRIGECEFERAQTCPRCVFVTIDPETLQKSPRQEPLRTLARYRSSPNNGVPFGVQFIPRRLGTLQVGDQVELI